METDFIGTVEDPLPDVRELAHRIEREWAALQQVISPLGVGQMTAPGAGGWSAKDELAHLSAWTRGVAALLRKQPRYPAMGLPPEVDPFSLDLDRLNQIIFENRRDIPLEKVLDEALAAHLDLLAAVSALSDDDLMQTYSEFQPQDGELDDDEPILYQIGGISYGHYAEHRQDVLKTLNRG